MEETPQPQMFGRYRVIGALGAGAMAQVYLGHDPDLDRRVAIKAMGAALQADPAMTERFRREARAIAALQHPHIVQVYDFGVAGDLHYLVMEYVHGRSLADWLGAFEQAGSRPPADEALTILEQVAAALDYAHARGVIHRDVKPGNILLRDGPALDAVLADFGLAMLLFRETEATQGRSFGTPDYIAPEQAVHSASAVPQSDIYSLAVIAYRMLTGRLPFEGDTPLDLALKRVREAPTPLRVVDPAIAPNVEQAVLKALARQPGDRYATASEFVAALRQAIAAPQPAAPAPASQTQIYPPGTPMIWPGAEREVDRPAGKPPQGVPAPAPAARPFRVPRSLAALLALLAVCVLCGAGLAAVIQALPGWGTTAVPTAQATTAVPVPTPAAPADTPVPLPPPSDVAGLVAALQDKIVQAREARQIDAETARELRQKLNDFAKSLDKDGQAKALEKLGDFVTYLDERARDGKIPTDLAAAWKLDAAAIEAAVRAGSGGG